MTLTMQAEIIRGVGSGYVFNKQQRRAGKLIVQLDQYTRSVFVKVRNMNIGHGASFTVTGCSAPDTRPAGHWPSLTNPRGAKTHYAYGPARASSTLRPAPAGVSLGLASPIPAAPLS